MGKSSIRKNFLRTAVGVAAMVAAVGQVNAAQFVGTWDPIYLGPYGDGSPFISTTGGADNIYLYFSGTATFDTGTCTADGQYFSAVGGSNPCGWSVVSAELILGGRDQAGNSFGQTQILPFPTNPLDKPQISRMDITNGKLSWIDATWFFYGIQGSIDNTLANWGFGAFPYANEQPWFNLSFSGEQARLGWRVDLTGTYTNSGALPSDWNCTAGDTPVINRTCGAALAKMEFAPAIPEPSTYALMGLGLFAVAAMRRRAVKRVAQV